MSEERIDAIATGLREWRKEFSGGVITSGMSREMAGCILRQPAFAAANLDYDPAYLEWADLRTRLWAKLDTEDLDLVATRSELLAVLSWADKFNRDAQPRRDDEQRSYDIISRAAKILGPKDDEAVFEVRISAENTTIHTRAGNNAVPLACLDAAIAALMLERDGVFECPAHAAPSTTPARNTSQIGEG